MRLGSGGAEGLYWMLGAWLRRRVAFRYLSYIEGLAEMCDASTYRSRSYVAEEQELIEQRLHSQVPVSYPKTAALLSHNPTVCSLSSTSSPLAVGNRHAIILTPLIFNFRAE